jgi:hypothetical protein
MAVLASDSDIGHISGELITKKKGSNTDPIKKPGVNTGARDG